MEADGALPSADFPISIPKGDPHRFLGINREGEETLIRFWRPGFENAPFELFGKVQEAKRVDKSFFFEYRLSEKIEARDYKVYYPSGLLAYDPYAQEITISKNDLDLFNKGCHYELYRILGATALNGGYRFAVWAPSAANVFLIGDFNHWCKRMCPLRKLGASGVWELFVPGLQEGEKYKFVIETKEGHSLIKSDPYAFSMEKRPHTASILFDVERYSWEALDYRPKDLSGPINIYEVHLGSWKSYPQEFPNYREIAIDLASYVKKMGFTHIELLPILEHPLDESWGYQVSGFFAATSRYGTPADFQFFVDFMHKEGIGVILDWVPAHFPLDGFSLAGFDGTALYEHEDPRKGIHPHWNTAIFNYDRKEVSNFLIASALFWLEVMRLDGLRVDAVASMLYLDYGRKEGEWIPNRDGGNLNYEAIEFLKHLNSIIKQKFPDKMMIAEESTTFQGVTHPDGLGFDMKWNMGWMNDTLRYFSKDPLYRTFHQDDLTFSLCYAFAERFMCPLSHDEVVYEKKSLLSKMPGPDWQKFANVRLFYSYMLCHPGKNLLFMGGEIGEWKEWACKGSLDWSLLDYAFHKGLWDMVRDLNHFYLKAPALWEKDFIPEGYEWVDFRDKRNCVISYLRRAKEQTLLCIHNFTPQYHPEYWIPLKNAKDLKEIFNSDAARYGGSGKQNDAPFIHPDGCKIALSPLATMVFSLRFRLRGHLQNEGEPLAL